ncbi:hypothetical protein C3747_248g19 [Trypanosoma cruzi]|uniref:RING-type E3 ubiquitin transferase n=2 Tax=Trypanosoma cruzi TaxID=5693 RepID=Q4DSB2_TRYCC|nr:hypothetical protein, conserved [Trypanosoma cruzi]EAN95431.1 hypothetical protein, conserved [Trypanosoma cruzi]KAF5221537.1 hypothetical protein ECC02_005424 [Trypanosoma cruzi]KAF8285707.1 putative Ring finger domain containing protein [Trypanosoma cruzi]PWU97120.1 hypothetical protein C3747_248g19 [Trypanosoma cruzi]RNC57221.1 protein containing C-terminal RING-finger [Trypanosoma cruzi]|eukprot:XP_817282.1 hypothetical protein [Trypanosoma cruzi strain CL Brener]
MEDNNGPKRARSEAMEDTSSRSTTPLQVDQSATPEATPARDPLLEEQMDQLGVDEDFKASLRCMSPNTRRDVMNDIIRGQQQERTTMATPFGLLSILGETSILPLFSGVDVRLSVEEDSEDEQRGSDGSRAHSSPRRMSPSSGADDRSENSRMETPALREQVLRSQMLYLLHIMRGSHIANTISEAIAQRSLGITQDIDDMSYEQLLELQERIGFVSKGITREQMQQCMQDVPWPKEGSCVVCQSEWQDGTDGNERSVELKVCHHIFHQRCIEQWLGSNKTCPVCKKDVV